MRAVAKETWTVANAKARFSELVEKTKSEGPQTVTRNGKPAVVLVSADEWEANNSRKGTLLEFFRTSPLRGANLDLERLDEQPRDIDL